jgi:elongation factor P
MYQTSDIRKGLKIEMEGYPYVVVDFQFVKPGKGTAFTRTKLKNMLTGAVLDRSFRTGEGLAEADVDEQKMQYLYADGEDYMFMNMEDYDQVGIPAKVLGRTKDFLIEEMLVQVLFYKSQPVIVELPNFVEIQITYCEPGVRGNTAQGATKPATLSTGATLNVPLFVEDGTWIKIDTRTGDYVERVRR